MNKRVIKKSIFVFFILQLGMNLSAQLINDDCFTAFHIRELDDYCTDSEEYSTEVGTPSIDPEPFCWPQGTATNDLWFSFAPTKPAIEIKLFGLSNNIPNGLVQPSLAVYRGPCQSLTEVGCSSAETGSNDRELILTDLIIGQLYYIRIDARNNNTGHFQLCLNVFNSIPDPESDCSKAVILCDKSSFSVESIVGTGTEQENLGNTCLSVESASVWYKWTCRNSGNLTFTLTPNNFNDPEEDLDFAVFRLPGGLDDCNNRELLRCMASGETINAPASQNAPCFGPTGLSEAAEDLQELPGCSPGDDNFVADIDMIEGESYVLVVNNYSKSGFGFAIDFGGTGTFLGPDPDFEIDAVQAFECDKTILFNDRSIANTDQITDWNWNFGAGANPNQAQGDIIHEVVYESFGEKLVALTVETSRGCQVTKILDLYVEPCCQDTSTLDVNAVGFNLICAGEPDGRIEAQGISGSPSYLYSIDGGFFQPSPFFSELGTGSYTVNIQDQKGCMNSTMITLIEPEPLIVDAGPDLEVNLGESARILADHSPPGSIVSVNWTPTTGMSCIDCFNPSVLAPGTTTYNIEITDQSGCVTSDEVTVFVNLIRPIFSPNVITLFGNPQNRYFKVFSNAGAERIDEMWIYDRWGSLIYNGKNLPVSDEELIGWDGTFQGEKVTPGVFTWHARVRFIDQEVIDYSGTVTVVR